MSGKGDFDALVELKARPFGLDLGAIVAGCCAKWNCVSDHVEGPVFLLYFALWVKLGLRIKSVSRLFFGNYFAPPCHPNHAAMRGRTLLKVCALNHEIYATANLRYLGNFESKSVRLLRS